MKNVRIILTIIIVVGVVCLLSNIFPYNAIGAILVPAPIVAMVALVANYFLDYYYYKHMGA